MISQNIKKKIIEIKTIKEKVNELEAKKQSELEKISRLTIEQAKEEVVNIAEKHYGEDILARIQKIETVGKEKIEQHAKKILTSIIQRLSSAVPVDIMSTNVNLPSDEIKGKIIGKEGRNIKAFERATGVDVIIDDTPGIITLSSFDPVRRQIAYVALEALIMDGRIQPAKIEEIVEKSKNKT